jgi:hypothetical protein
MQYLMNQFFTLPGQALRQQSAGVLKWLTVSLSVGQLMKKAKSLQLP